MEVTKAVFVLIMLWTNPNGTDGHLILHSGYPTEAACIEGANHASKRSELVDNVPDDLTFICPNIANVTPEWLN